jgi:hypothetical protein
MFSVFLPSKLFLRNIVVVCNLRTNRGLTVPNRAKRSNPSPSAT